MKILKGLTIAIFCLIATTNFAQITIADVTLPATITKGGTSLSLNGAGLREKLWFDLYVGGLYLTEKMSDANKIINSDAAMNIHLEITSKLISSENMTEAITEGFEKSTNGGQAKLKTEIDMFIAAFSEEIVVGNKFDISFNPSIGVIVEKNGKKLATIKGMEFKKALVGIWLGEKPADKKLKDGMLGL